MAYLIGIGLALGVSVLATYVGLDNAGASPPPATPPPHPLAELLRRTFQSDVLTCLRCGGTRRVVAVVLRSTTAQAILEHLRLPSRSLRLAPATSPPQLSLW
jgi:hypothetical protein